MILLGAFGVASVVAYAVTLVVLERRDRRELWESLEADRRYRREFVDRNADLLEIPSFFAKFKVRS